MGNVKFRVVSLWESLHMQVKMLSFIEIKINCDLLPIPDRPNESPKKRSKQFMQIRSGKNY